ncbi:MAG: iron-containing alcohol dehydrogenase [Anaerostipes hadrus]|nr:iron-containing alcohol dehydrogenase [Anaerostipes hadrus]
MLVRPLQKRRISYGTERKNVGASTDRWNFGNLSSEANKFGVNPFTAVVISGILLYPDLTQLMEKGNTVHFLGFGLRGVTYHSSVIPIIMVRFLMAGIGDALATYYEAAASVQSDAVTMAGGHATKAAITLAKLCRDTLLEDGLKAKAAAESGVSTKALENIVEANTYLSGIGFESSGLAAAHAIHNGLTVLNETHALLHGEKVAFGLICQLVLENTDQEELEKIIVFCKKCGLPTTFEELGIAEVSDERLLEAAALSCAEDDTMGNMPFEVSAQDVFAAMKTADRFSRDLR